jgi:protein involved in polysaccharide export with SLBB domain
VSFKSPDNNLITVLVSGAVDYPGTYVLNDNATVEDLYQLIGNFKKQAYLEGIVLTREAIRERQVKAIQKSKEDLNKALLTSAQKGDALGDMDIIRALSESIEPENLGRLAGDFSPKSQASLNTVLLDNDRIVVPRNPNAISILGEVLNPIVMEYKKNLSLNSAINNAGGYQQYADKRRVYVIKANGIVKKASRNIFVRNVKLDPGDTIIVPRKIITESPGIQALIPITQVLSDLAFSAAALDNLQSN